MKKNKKQLSIFKRIGLIAIALFSALGSLFIPFASKKQNNFASAISNDSSEIGYGFKGSDILFFETLVYTPNSSDNIALPRFISFDLEIMTTLVDGFSVAFGATLFSYNGTSLYNDIPFYPQDPLTSEVNRFITRPNYNDGLSLSLVSSLQPEMYIPLFIQSDDGFIANCKSVNIFVSPIGTYLGDNFDVASSYFSSAVINIKYFDFNDNSFTIQIISPTQFTALYDDRTYYFLDNFTDNDYYEQGFRDGLVSNQQNIYNSGFSAGRDSGYQTGFDAGVLSANDYSFISLIGAVIDTPIKAFSGLFNFNFLGVNLLDFFLGLLTFGVVIFVIKLLLGGK